VIHGGIVPSRRNDAAYQEKYEIGTIANMDSDQALEEVVSKFYIVWQRHVFLNDSAQLGITPEVDKYHLLPKLLLWFWINRI